MNESAPQGEPGWKRAGRNGPLDWWLGCKDHHYDYQQGCMSCGMAQGHNIAFQEKLNSERAAPQAAPSVAAPTDFARMKAERDMLAQAIADAAHRAGIYNGYTPLSGPHLLMLLEDLARAALPLPAVVQAAPGDVHPAAPQTTVPTAAPFSEPRALGQGELPVRLMEVLTFLHGAGPLEGVWFGDDHPTETGRFWWRSRLRAAMSAPGGGGRA